MPKATTQVCCICGADPNASPSLTALLEPLPASSSLNIARLLNTNDVPQDADIPPIQQTIVAAEDRLCALDAQILPLKAALAQLVQRRTKIAEHLREHRAVLSVVRRVPPDLICEIFDLATVRSRAGPGAPPWRLGCISRSWRQYTVEYPLLWSCLTIPESPLDQGVMTTCLSALRTQLLRSGAASLDIYWSAVDSQSRPAHIGPHTSAFQFLAQFVPCRQI
ncbi:F-box domain-containing protein [Mycena sanguinolenta]|uniref:F-box domain-containing protein n=1 Tax=Mycena sanguinolenta TaxID=230812 RepID=A0A8H6XRF7_9AGAR|nr:F-box domain-containing protein [Mycena sanguinolenta]